MLTQAHTGSARANLDRPIEIGRPWTRVWSTRRRLTGERRGWLRRLRAVDGGGCPVILRPRHRWLRVRLSVGVLLLLAALLLASPLGGGESFLSSVMAAAARFRARIELDFLG